MKRAFTLSEALITLAIIGVLASILIPMVNNVRPDKDKITYKKALYDMQAAVSNALESSLYTRAANSLAYWGDENVGESDFCETVADSLNTSGKINCNVPVGTSSYSNPNFVTTDGIRFWGLEGKVFSKGVKNVSDVEYRDICVDRGMSNSELNKIGVKRYGIGRDSGQCANGLKIRVKYDGKVITPEATSKDKFQYENDMIYDSLSITKKPSA